MVPLALGTGWLLERLLRRMLAGFTRRLADHGADGERTNGAGPGPSLRRGPLPGEGQHVATVRGTDPRSRRVAQRMRTRSRMHHHPGSTSPLAKLSRLEVAAA